MSDARKDLADPDLRRELHRFVLRRAPDGDAEDLVQTILADALAAESLPEDDEERRRWLFGVAKHKIADAHRKRGRDPGPISSPEGEVTAESAPHGAEDLLRWAERELPANEGAPGTLGWMLREGDGERLEDIAREANVPAPTVRQRVARLRRYFRQRWAVQAALAGGFAVALGVVYWKAKDTAEPPIAQESRDDTLDRARNLRLEGLEHCRAKRFAECLGRLDAAREIDPVGDEAQVVREARGVAARAQAPDEVEPQPPETPPPVDTAPPEQKPPRVVPPPPPKVGPKKTYEPVPQSDDPVQQKRSLPEIQEKNAPQK